MVNEIKPGLQIRHDDDICMLPTRIRHEDIEKRKIGIGIEDLAQVMQSVGHSLKEIDDVVTAALKEIITSE
jgi:hypothetical protein